MGALSDLIEQEFGGAYDTAETQVPTNGTGYRAIPHNPECVGTTIINLGANDVYLSPSSGVSSASGIFLSASGGSMSLTVRDDLVLAGHEWYAISPAGASALFVIRILRYRAGK